MSSLWLAHSCGPFWRGKFLGIGDVLACDIRRPNQWSGVSSFKGRLMDEIPDAEYKVVEHQIAPPLDPSPRWRFQPLGRDPQVSGPRKLLLRGSIGARFSALLSDSRLSTVEGGGADASRTRSLPSTLRLEACGAGSLESCDCAHMRVLQAGRSLVPLTKMPFSPGAPAKTSPSFPTFPTLPSSARPPRGMSGFWGMFSQGFSADV